MQRVSGGSGRGRVTGGLLGNQALPQEKAEREPWLLCSQNRRAA